MGKGGYPGGMGGMNMNNLMKQAQKMQAQMEQTTKELEAKTYTASAGGGAVEVTVTGKRQLTEVRLSKEVVDPEDIEMLQDLILAAVNEAIKKSEQDSQAAIGQITGGLGGFGF